MKATLRLPFFSLYFLNPDFLIHKILHTPGLVLRIIIGKQLTLAEPVPQRVETVAGRYTEDSSEDL